MRSTVLAFLLLSARGGVAALAAWLVCRALRRAHAPSRLLCWLWLAVGLRFVLPWGIPLKLPRPESAPLAAAADTVQELDPDLILLGGDLVTFPNPEYENMLSLCRSLADVAPLYGAPRNR